MDEELVDEELLDEELLDDKLLNEDADVDRLHDDQDTGEVVPLNCEGASN